MQGQNDPERVEMLKGIGFNFAPRSSSQKHNATKQGLAVPGGDDRPVPDSAALAEGRAGPPRPVPDSTALEEGRTGPPRPVPDSVALAGGRAGPLRPVPDSVALAEGRAGPRLGDFSATMMPRLPEVVPGPGDFLAAMMPRYYNGRCMDLKMKI